MYMRVNVKLSLCRSWSRMGDWKYSSTDFLTSVTKELNGHLHVPAVLPRGKCPLYPFTNRLVGPHSQCGSSGEGNNLPDMPGIEPQFLGGPLSGLVTVPTTSTLFLAMYAASPATGSPHRDQFISRLIAEKPWRFKGQKTPCWWSQSPKYPHLLHDEANYCFKTLNFIQLLWISYL